MLFHLNNSQTIWTEHWWDREAKNITVWSDMPMLIFSWHRQDFLSLFIRHSLFFHLSFPPLPFVSLQRAPVWSPASAVSSCPLATANRPWLLCSACSGESASLPGTHWTCWPWSSTHPTRGRPLRHALKSAWHLRRRGQWCWMTCWMTSRELPCVDWPARSDGWHCGVKSLVVRVM